MIVSVLVPESLRSDPVVWAAFDEETYGPLIELLDSDVGIDVIHHQPVSTKDFSYHDMLEMKPLEYEYLSFGGDDGITGNTTSSVATRG
jgi:hypothetical protein